MTDAYYDKYAELWLFRCANPDCRVKTERSFRVESDNPTRFDTVCRDCRRAMKRRKSLYGNEPPGIFG